MSFDLLVAILLSYTASSPTTQPAPSGLTARHLALLYNARSPESKRLAEHYAAVRSISPDRLLALDVPVAETLPRTLYLRSVRPVVREALNGRWKDQPIRCLVTFYDLPIRIGPQQPTAQARALAARAVELSQKTEREFEALITRVEALARTDPAVTASRPVRSSSPKEQADRYEAARRDAYKRIESLSPQLRSAATQSLVRLIEEGDGVAGLVSVLRPTNNTSEHDRQKIALLEEQVRKQQSELNQLMAKGTASPLRPQVWERSRSFVGLRGLLQHLDVDRNSLLGRETEAAFDSELSLVAWDDYPLYRWIMNLLNLRHSRNPELRGLVPAGQWTAPIYMVSRLDGPSPDIVIRMIDQAVKVEGKGLSGHVYLDARGIRLNDGYYPYDQSLIQLADLLRARTRLPVTLDTQSALFGPGQCPDTALYCGWYSHKEYIDAFDFVPGAVACHLASSEAVSLRDSSKNYWCKSLLADGACATLGPVTEPYLQAFPLPKDFFGLLLTGRYTLVECFYYAQNFNSWMLILLGDPLYRPFARNPRLSPEDFIDPRYLPLSDLTAPFPQTPPPHP